MPNYNIHIHAFDDLPMCRDAVASVPDGVLVYIFDGRYADFPGEYDTTPGLESFCADHPDCTYYAPPPEHRPFEGDSTLREPVARKARWAFEHLPADEWTLKLDTDERLERFDADLDTLARDHKYAPVIRSTTGRSYHIARLFVPRHWTPWVDDCLLPRRYFLRDTALDRLATVWTEDLYRRMRFIKRGEIDTVRIDNHGPERPAGYQDRRAAQLRAMGREDRFMELKEREEL